MDDFERLLKTLSGIKGKFLLSSYPFDILAKFSKANGWYTKVYEQGVSINNKAGYLKRKWEVLTANYPIRKITWLIKPGNFFVPYLYIGTDRGIICPCYR
jgi:hypothetical protein